MNVIPNIPQYSAKTAWPSRIAYYLHLEVCKQRNNPQLWLCLLSCYVYLFYVIIGIFLNQNARSQPIERWLLLSFLPLYRILLYPPWTIIHQYHSLYYQPLWAMVKTTSSRLPLPTIVDHFQPWSTFINDYHKWANIINRCQTLWTIVGISKHYQQLPTIINHCEALSITIKYYQPWSTIINHY